jgi:hypothetical protein
LASAVGGGLVNNQQRRARFDRYIARLDFRAFDESVEGPQRFQFVVLGGKWSAQPATQAKRILVVEDELIIRMLLEDMAR